METVAPPVFERLSALGDSTRSRLLALLQQAEFGVLELCQALQLPQSTVSRHLKLLAEDGWVTMRSEGTRRHYRMSPSLPPEARLLWELVKAELVGDGFFSADHERARSVKLRRIELSKSFFSTSAGRWDDVRRELYGRDVELLPLHGLLDPGWTVGDLGTGSGQLAVRLAPFVRRVVAVDRSREMLAAATARVGSTPNVELREGDLEDLPLRNGELDLALVSLVLHFVSDPPAALREARRALADDGRLVIVDLRTHGREEYRETMGHLWLGFEPEQLLGWLEEADFKSGVVRPLPPHPEAKGPLLFVATARRGG